MNNGCFFVVGNCNMYVIAVILTKFGPSVCNGGAQGVVVFFYTVVLVDEQHRCKSCNDLFCVVV